MIRIIKIIDLNYISIISICFGLGITIILDKYIFKYNSNTNDENNNKSKYKLILEICLMIGLLISIAYIARNIVILIPFPLDGLYGFSHLKVKELNSGALVTSFIMLFSSTLQSKVNALKNKLKN